jgi:hypothetical protein
MDSETFLEYSRSIGLDDNDAGIKAAMKALRLAEEAHRLMQAGKLDEGNLYIAESREASSRV